MKSADDSTTVKPSDTYVILGASGNTGSIISDFLLSKGKEGTRHRARPGATAALCAQGRSCVQQQT